MFEKRVTMLTVCKNRWTVFSDCATSVQIIAEAGGEFVEVSQRGRYDADRAIRIESAEWPTLRAAIDEMLASCREGESSDDQSEERS